MNKKILFLYNGGTIGQIPRLEKVNGGEQFVLYPPSDDTEFKLACTKVLSRVEVTANMEISFELITTKDSSNIFPEDWTTLAERIQKAQDEEGYDAVGVAHGTDTLPHTATALAFALHGSETEKSGLNIPVVLMGAQNTIHMHGGDGEFNIENVFRVIDACLDHGVADVLVSFWSRVLLGCRTMKVSEKEFDAFRSPGYPDVGTINSLGVTLFPHLLKKKSEASYAMHAAPKFSNDILTFDLSPGLHPDMIESVLKDNKVSALILKSLGEGNVPTEGKYNFLPLIEKVTKEMEIPVIITSRFIGGYVGYAHYEVGLRAINAGGMPSFDHTGPAVEVKARWLMGNDICTSVDGFRKAFATSYVGEITK
jgi:L-asparaginase